MWPALARESHANNSVGVGRCNIDNTVNMATITSMYAGGNVTDDKEERVLSKF